VTFDRIMPAGRHVMMFCYDLRDVDTRAAPELAMAGSRHSRRGLSVFAGVVIALLICDGCGSDRIPLSGEITFDGKPVQKGSITLEPVDRQGATTGGEIVEGKYQLVGDAAPLPGKKIVRISAIRKTGRMIAAGPPLPSGAMVEEMIRYIPERYNTQTTLTCEVSRDGSKKIDFTLSSR
jgi:hypothetical protein